MQAKIIVTLKMAMFVFPGSGSARSPPSFDILTSINVHLQGLNPYENNIKIRSSGKN
jgi:hypothetical protein